MTTTNEEIRSLENTKQFLFDLLNPQVTKRVPKYIRRRASSCLKHFPLMIHSPKTWATFMRGYEQAKVLQMNRKQGVTK